MSIDDYLDLFNYAKAINDGQWQAEIIENLKKLGGISEEQKRMNHVKDLWTRFDQINLMLLGLFDKLNNQEDTAESYRWKEKIWELKMERINLAKQIQERYIKIR